MLQARKPNDNLLIAPITSTLAFGALQNGASEKAGAEISATFGRPDLTLPQVNAAAHDLLTQLKPGERVNPYWDSTLRFSISLWIKVPELFRPEWRKVAAESYGATTQTLSSDPAANAKVMDAYLAKALGKQLSIPAPVLTKREFALMIGSLFNAKWSTEFKEDHTLPKEFKFRDQSKHPVEMMWQKRWFPYLKGDHFQAVLLQYTGRFGMYVFLPDEDDGIDSLVSSLNAENWSKWTSSFEQHRNGTLELPKFHVETSRDTTGDYKELGIREPFSNNYLVMAGLVSSLDGAKLTRVLEDASIDVTEKRTVVITRGLAAGVIGGIEGIVPGAQPPPPFHMLVDHPFLFAIVDRPTNAILYVGVVTAPPTTNRKVKSYRDPVTPQIPRMPK
jgi:serine protease inhibitor